MKTNQKGSTTKFDGDWSWILGGKREEQSSPFPPEWKDENMTNESLAEQNSEDNDYQYQI